MGEAPPKADSLGETLPGPAGGDEDFLDRLAREEVPGEESEASDEEPLRAGRGAEAEEPLPEEPWAHYPPEEQELWERARPRHLRREAQQARALRFPMTALNRLMRLHPGLQMKSSEAQEVISLATVLLLKALAKSAARSKGPGQRVGFEDLKTACAGTKELQFMQPFSCSLDATALVLRGGGEAAGDLSTAAASRAAPRGGGRGAPKPLETGQSSLGAAFALNAAHEADEEVEAETAAEAAPAAAEVTPEREAAKPKETGKRKAPSSAQKPASKAARRGPAPKKAAEAGKAEKIASPAPAGGLANFFRRADTAGA